MDIPEFQKLMWDYYHKHGRDLPWRRTQDPYAILISEVMLQQTQVARVLTKFPEFIAAFPNCATLANASLSSVLERWQGMGYNRRALWLRQAAIKVQAEFNGQLPCDPKILETLPGIGHNTAGSIAAFAYNAPVVFIETNIRRTFIHHFFASPVTQKEERLRQSSVHEIAAPAGSGLAMTNRETVSDKELLPLIEQSLDHDNPRQWYYALMDYGANLAKTVSNPNRRSRHYAKQSKFEGSRRQVRANILRALLVKPMTIDQLSGAVSQSTNYIQTITDELAGEDFILAKSGIYRLVE